MEPLAGRGIFFYYSPRWSHWLAGGLDAQSFHIVNILLHAVVCVLLLPVCDLVLQGQVFQGHDLVLRGQGRYSWKVVVSGLLFAVHPVHSESVSEFCISFEFQLNAQSSR